MNRDFEEMLRALSEAGADFMVIGAHAVAVYARPRATGDLDIWVRPTPSNAARVWRALVEFGAPLDALTRQDLTSDDVVFQIGVAPSRIDLLTTIGGVEFADAWARRTQVELWGLDVPVIGRDDLIRNKRAAGRERDLADVAELERAASA
jgi:predicted nucleotidyltransferase